MARTSKLTTKRIEAAKVGPAVLHDGGGLYLRISTSGAKSWVFRYQIQNKRRDMGLGPYPEISLAEVRARALEHRKQRLDGIDPLDAKKARRQAERLAIAKGRTFREAADEFINRNRPAWSDKHADDWAKTLETYVYPLLGELPVAAIDVGLVVQALEPIWTTKAETASRVRGRIEMILDASTVRGFREGPNPAQWKGNLAHIFPARSKVRRVDHYDAMPIDQIPSFVTALRERSGMVARALEFTILTAARTGETLGATWAEIDLDAKVWTVPPSRMKADKEHRVPLSAVAIELLHNVRPLAVAKDGIPILSAPLFHGTRRGLPLSPSPLLKLLRRMGQCEATTHGFRSGFRDWAAERTAYPREVVEMALAHVIENRVEAAYRRGDLFQKRVHLMEAWASFCEAPRAGEVIAFQATR